MRAASYPTSVAPGTSRWPAHVRRNSRDGSRLGIFGVFPDELVDAPEQPAARGHALELRAGDLRHRTLYLHPG